MKIYQVFVSYPLFYQPYIPPVIDALQKQNDIDVKIKAFRGEEGKRDEGIVLPYYRKRKVLAKIFQLFNKEYRNLDYFEIKVLKEKVDIVHIQHSSLFPKVINLFKIPKNKRPKIVITLRGGDTYVKPWIDDKWISFYKNFGNKVDAFIVMSEDQKEYLSRWGVPLDNIHVIPISFGNKFTVEPRAANKNKLRLVSVFRLCWEKNIVDSLRFVRTLKEKNIPVEYDVYGDGASLGQLYYLRDKYNLNNEVNILGKVPNEKLKKNLRKYDFMLQLSHSESLGMSVIEAQTYGIPALVSNNGGLPEIIKNKWNGIIMDLENFEGGIQEVIEVWNSESLYIEMSKNAIDRSQQNFSIENEFEKLHALYKSFK